MREVDNKQLIEKKNNITFAMMSAKETNKARERVRECVGWGQGGVHPDRMLRESFFLSGSLE